MTARTPAPRTPPGSGQGVLFLGWRMVLIAGIGVFLVGPAQTYGVSVFVDPMLREFGWSRALISTAYAVATLVGALAVMLFGRMLDRFGHRTVLTAAAVGFGGALLVMSTVTGPLSLTLGYALLRGFGIGGLLLARCTLAAQWFERRRGRALSLVALGGSLSLALVPLANDLLIEHFGWREAWRIDALVIWLVLLPIVALFVRGRPEDAGQRPDGMLTSETEETAFTGERLEPAWEPWQAIRTRTFWLLLFASMAPGLIVTGLDFNQISTFTARGLSSTLAAGVFTISSVLALLSGLAGGWLADRISPRFVLPSARRPWQRRCLCSLPRAGANSRWCMEQSGVSPWVRGRSRSTPPGRPTMAGADWGVSAA